MRCFLSGFAVAVVVAWAGAARAASDCAALPQLPLSFGAAEERFPRCNRDVRAAELAAAAVAADRRIAMQRPNPTLTLGASNVNPRAGVGAGSLRDKTFDSSIRVEQLIERGGKAELREAQAEELYAAARADVAEQLRVQRLVMRTAFFDLAAAQEKVRLQREFGALAADSAAASKRRFEAGEVPRAEADRFRLDAARAANDALQAEADRDRARLELAKLIGAEAAARTLVVEVAWPPVSETNLQGTGISYGLTFSVPLRVRHANEGEAARAIADFDSAQAVLARAEAQAEAEARLTEADWLAARQRRERFESEVRPAAREVGSAAEFAYSRGATGVLDLLDARRSLKAVELDEAQARADAAKAWARRAAAVETVEE